MRKVSLSYRSWMKSLYKRNSAAVTASPSGMRDRSNLNSRWCRRTGRNSLSCSTEKKKIKHENEISLYNQIGCIHSIQKIVHLFTGAISIFPLAEGRKISAGRHREIKWLRMKLQSFSCGIGLHFQRTKTYGNKRGGEKKKTFSSQILFSPHSSSFSW